MHNNNEKIYHCPVDITLDIVFNDKWKLAIIWHLIDGEKRFKELSEILNEISQKTLTVKLKELEQKNIINREVFPIVPLKVVYSLTPIGFELNQVLENMHAWGIKYASDKNNNINFINESCSNKS